MSDDSDAPLFERGDDADTYVPTVFTRGPWDPTLLHGGPVAALFAEVLQATRDTAAEMQPVRLTVDLVRPVPIAPLSMSAGVVREGKRLRVVEGNLTWQGKAVARATLTSIKPVDIDAANLNPPLEPPADSPDDVDTSWGPPATRESFVGGAMDFMFTSQVGLGHGVGWLRLRRRVLADTPISPLARAAAAADVGNAVSARRGGDLPRFSFVNADLSLSLSRLPEGEWLRLEATSRWEASGIGWVRSTMGDQHGTVGAVSNALVLEASSEPFGWEQP